jgi:alkanesulfonate monooxygenase SsuD/methylene tetrahydromethanopterin reductase-like flavin-dependent oxidoreductase (luciferase family)
VAGGQRQIFDEFLQLVDYADQAGFYAVQLAEHQGTPLSIDVSPALVLSAISQRTKTIRLGALTWCLPWYDPYRLYNELCMLDQMSGGRVELGVGRGISPIESRYYGIQSIDESRERYRETLDILFEAFRSPVLNFTGKFHTYQDVELYNQPHQKPYPPLWFPTSQAKSTLEFVAQHGYNTVINVGTMGLIREQRDQYWDLWRAHEHDPGRHNGHVAHPLFGTARHIVVANTEAEAVAAHRAATESWGAASPI